MGKARAATAAASARQEATLALSQPLPALLHKFQTEPRKARAPRSSPCAQWNEAGGRMLGYSSAPASPLTCLTLCLNV